MVGKIRTLIGAAFVLLAVQVQPALATPIPTGSSDLIINFNFGQALATLSATTIFSSTGSGLQSISIDFFSDLNGQNLVSTVPFQQLAPFSNIGLEFNALNSPEFISPAFLDGAFSLGFRVTPGPADLTSISALGITAAGLQITTSGSIVTVPEPATLALLGVGLAGIGFAWRRKLN